VYSKRVAIITADDFGIGPATSQGIIDLAKLGLISASVLLVTSPHAAGAVSAWRRAGQPLELGWHACLTLDGPILPPREVPSLIAPDGRFWPLPSFLARLLSGRVCRGDVEAELRAQYARFQDLVGSSPSMVNAHHHLQIFPPVGRIVHSLLAKARPLPYVRRVREPWKAWVRLSGGRGKRALLSALGTKAARELDALGFPGNHWWLGIDRWVSIAEPGHLVSSLKRVPGGVLEFVCHPGYLDGTLVGRDCASNDGRSLHMRLAQLNWLREGRLVEACRAAQWTIVSRSPASSGGALPWDELTGTTSHKFRSIQA